MVIPPWLRIATLKGDEDDVTDFVVASAISSTTDSLDMDSQQPQNEMKDFPCEKKFYLRSAENGDAFALTRVGTLIEERAFTEHLLKGEEGVLDQLRDESKLPAPFRIEPTAITVSAETILAMRFWFEGAVQGNPLAQRALADELMMSASETGDEDTRILAAVLFALAAQQGDEGLSEALSHVVDFDIAIRKIEDDRGFLASPVVQTAQSALEAC